jgi:hypothetical protein
MAKGLFEHRRGLRRREPARHPIRKWALAWQPKRSCRRRHYPGVHGG